MQYFILLVALLTSFACEVRADWACVWFASSYETAWASDPGTFGGAQTLAEFICGDDIYGFPSIPLADITVTLTSPTGRTSSQSASCTANQFTDTYLTWDVSDPGVYLVTTQYGAYATVPGYVGCYGPPGISYMYLNFTVSLHDTTFKNPMVVENRCRYTALSCAPGTTPQCTSGEGTTVSWLPPCPPYIYVKFGRFSYNGSNVCQALYSFNVPGPHGPCN